MWTAARFSNGYGAFRLGERQVRAHRYAYETFVGPIPEGYCICHRCDNRPCCNPAHLFLGTHLDNAHDRERKGRGRYGTIGPLPPVAPLPRARGERHGVAVLTDDLVREARAMYAAGMSQQAIADALGVCSQVTISSVVRHKT
jgi:hypothetical protein